VVFSLIDQIFLRVQGLLRQHIQKDKKPKHIRRKRGREKEEEN